MSRLSPRFVEGHSVLQGAVVEGLGREFREARMHSVLHLASVLVRPYFETILKTPCCSSARTNLRPS